MNETEGYHVKKNKADYSWIIIIIEKETRMWKVKKKKETL